MKGFLIVEYMHTHSEVVTIVNEVIETLNERVAGYSKAADHVKEANLAKIFSDNVKQSQKFIADLMPFSDVDSPEEIGKGPMGTLYQGWMNLKERITGYDTDSIIGDCISGEEAAIKVYQGALKDEDLPADLRYLLEGQYGEIKASQQKLKMFKKD